MGDDIDGIENYSYYLWQNRHNAFVRRFSEYTPGLRGSLKAGEVDVYVKVNYIPGAGGPTGNGPKSAQED
jgi:hypothetical protein